jgi:hypothetical protein
MAKLPVRPAGFQFDAQQQLSSCLAGHAPIRTESGRGQTRTALWPSYLCRKCAHRKVCGATVVPGGRAQRYRLAPLATGLVYAAPGLAADCPICGGVHTVRTAFDPVYALQVCGACRHVTSIFQDQTAIMQRCQRCGGTGQLRGRRPCPRCRGYRTFAYVPWAASRDPRQCAHGRAARVPCPVCDYWRYQQERAVRGAAQP